MRAPKRFFREGQTAPSCSSSYDGVKPDCHDGWLAQATPPQFPHLSSPTSVPLELRWGRICQNWLRTPCSTRFLVQVGPNKGRQWRPATNMLKNPHPNSPRHCGCAVVGRETPYLGALRPNMADSGDQPPTCSKNPHPNSGQTWTTRATRHQHAQEPPPWWDMRHHILEH